MVYFIKIIKIFILLYIQDVLYQITLQDVLAGPFVAGPFVSRTFRRRTFRRRTFRGRTFRRRTFCRGSIQRTCKHLPRKKCTILNSIQVPKPGRNRAAFRGPASTCRERNPPFLIFCSGSKSRKDQGSIQRTCKHVPKRKSPFLIFRPDSRPRREQ